MWSETRLVRKDATVRLYGGGYETDPALAGRKVECVYDPFDLSVLEIPGRVRLPGPRSRA